LMSPSVSVLLLAVMPGVFFLLLSGRGGELRSPSGWLVAASAGLALAFAVAAAMALVFGAEEAVLEALGGEPYAAARLGFWACLAGFLLGGLWRVPRLSRKVCKMRIVLEHLLAAFYAAGATPKLKVRLLSGEEFCGRCIRYKWTEPKSLLLASGGEEAELVIVSLSSVEKIVLLNWAELRYADRRPDPWRYVRLVADDLPDLLRGKKDACGNMIE